MMDIVPFKPEHVKEMELQDSQKYLSSFANDNVLASLQGDWSFTGVVNGVPIGCAGIIPMWQGRGIAWAYLSSRATKHQFIQVHRAVKKFLDDCYLQRIEMTVDCEFAEGHRWAHKLGFTMEAPRMRAYNPNGGDCALYARVR
jgi:hypothetical protein